MIMKKINDRVYEFFDLKPEDENIEITNVITSKSEDNNYWLYDELKTADLDVSSWMKDLVDDNDNDYDDYEDVQVITKPKSKRDELVDSLNYLKSKEFKTKQDRESIYTLEVILKNM
jgi:hypothetical protein